MFTSIRIQQLRFDSRSEAVKKLISNLASLFYEHPFKNDLYSFAEMYLNLRFL